MIALVAAGLLAAVAPASTAPAVAPAPIAIDLYTIGEGDEWVERFGHSAICVVHAAEPRRDRCYNYGTTSFSHPARMVWDFLRGRSAFWVSTTDPDEMIDSYVALDRTIWVQRLPLPPARAAELARRLAHQARRENRYYLYHHYEDNCTTRLRDFIDQASDGALTRDAVGVYPDLRSLSRAGWAELPALLYLGDVLIGRRVDRTPTPYQAMFLPLVLRDQVAAVLGAEPELIYQRRARPIGQQPGGPWPFVVVAAALAAPLALVRGRRRGRHAAMWWATLPPVLLGLLVWALAAVSAMPELRWNEVVLVLMPTDLLLVVGPRRWRRGYAKGRAIELLAVSLARTLGILRQPLWLLVLIPLPAVVAAMWGRSRSTC